MCQTDSSAPRAKLIKLLLMAGFVVVTFLGVCFLMLRAVPLNYEQKLHVRYQFEVRNPTAEYLPDVTLSIFAPLKRTQYQYVEKISASHGYELIEDTYGQQQLVFNQLALPPFGSDVITISVDLEVSKSGNPQAHYIEANSLADANQIDIGAASVARVSAFLAAEDEVASPKAIYQWLATHVKSVEFLAQDRGADYALTYLRGDCTEFMYAFMALSRFNGIPSWGYAGFVVEEGNIILKSTAYHNWNEYFYQGSWYLADVQGGQFGSSNKLYLAFRILGLEDGLTSSTSQRFIAHDQRITVRML